MSELKHSPGPWRIGYGCGDQDEYFTVVDANHEAVTDYSVANHDVRMRRAVMLANANLIAAAPTMYGALKALLADADARQDDQAAVRRLYEAWRMVREAIARTEGA